MKILDSKFMKGFIKMADDGFQQGWHERNGGNLSYRLKPEEVEMDPPPSEYTWRMDTNRGRGSWSGRGVFPCNRKR